MSQPFWSAGYRARRALLSLLSCFFVLLALTAPVLAQRAMPDAAPLTNFNPLCDGTLVHCLEIDDFAGHAYGHFQLLPKTDRRDTAAVFPFGVTLGLFDRIAGGVSTSYSFWKEEDALYQQLGPLRLSLVGRLLPLFPLFSSGGDSAQVEDGATHYAPPHGFRLGLAYEHEVRVGPFSGANSLGLLTNLASLSVIGSRMFGPVQLSVSLGALYDWGGLFATSQASAQLGIYLPFFQALKISVEGMARGFAAYVKKDALLPGITGQEPIQPQGLIGLNLSFHPHARVDLGVSVQRGFGGLAPWVISVNFLTLSVGRTYQGRAATPIAELAGDVAVEAAKSIKEFLENLPIDPKLDENCIILDDDGRVMGRFGHRTHNGYYCEQDGFRVPINHELLRDKNKDRLCLDTRKSPSTGKRELTDCLLERHGKEWVPVHRPRLDGSCRMTDSDGTVLGYVGEPTADGKRCRYSGERPNGAYGRYTTSEERPIGEPFYTDADRTAVCLDAAMQHCFMKPPAGRRTLAWGDDARATTALVGSFEGGLSEQAEDAKKIASAAKDVATGKIKVSTLYEEGKQAAGEVLNGAADLAKDPEKRAAAITAARSAIDRLEQAIDDWGKKPPEEQLEDVASTAGRAGSFVATGAVLNGGTRVIEEAAGAIGVASEGVKTGEAMAGAAKGGKKAATAERAIAEHHTPPARSLTKSAAGADARPLPSSVKTEDQVAEHLRQARNYGLPKELPNGRIRYYRELEPAKKPGEMAGQRVVREWDPVTDKKRTWMETVDHDGRVRQIRPQNGPDKVHRRFDRDGNYIGKW